MQYLFHKHCILYEKHAFSFLWILHDIFPIPSNDHAHTSCLRFQTLLFKLEVLDHKTREKAGLVTPTFASPIPVILKLDVAGSQVWGKMDGTKQGIWREGELESNHLLSTGKNRLIVVLQQNSIGMRRIWLLRQCGRRSGEARLGSRI